MSTPDSIEQQIKTLLENNGHTMDQSELISSIPFPEDEVLKVLNKLMQKGKVSYATDWRIHGHGKDYTTGLTE